MTPEAKLLIAVMAFKSILTIDTTIHDHPTWGLEQAQKIASRTLLQLEDQPKSDPSDGFVGIYK